MSWSRFVRWLRNDEPRVRRERRSEPLVEFSAGAGVRHFTVQTPGWRQRITELVAASLTVARGACRSAVAAPPCVAPAEPAPSAAARIQA